MFVFGICIGNEEKYLQYARPGLELSIRPGDLVIELRNQTSIHHAYNRILDHAQGLADLEAVVLLHEDLQILDTHFRTKVIRSFEHPNVGVVGAIGAINVSSLAWWEGEIRGVLAESRFQVQGDLLEGEVDTVDGALLCLSPQVTQKNRFDENYQGFHGYDADLCFSVRASGRTVFVTTFDLFHHTKGGYGDVASYLFNNDLFLEKWTLTATGSQND